MSSLLYKYSLDLKHYTIIWPIVEHASPKPSISKFTFSPIPWTPSGFIFPTFWQMVEIQNSAPNDQNITYKMQRMEKISSPFYNPITR